MFNDDSGIRETLKARLGREGARAARCAKALAAAAFAIALAACGGGGGGGGQAAPAPAPAPTYTVSGTVTGANAVIVALTGASTASKTTDANGNYTFSGLANGNYTVTPTLAGYTFNPVSVSEMVSGANITGQNFAATPVPAPTYSISGSISGAVVNGVTLTLSGAGSGSAASSSSGAYSFTALAPGTYTVTPSLSGFTFSPLSAQVTITNANQTVAAFTSTAIPTYSISGTVSGTDVAGVTITVTGAANANTTTDASGNYTVTGLYNGQYTVTPSASTGAAPPVNCTFAPVSSSVTLSANVTGNNFVSAGCGPTHMLSGTVTGPWASGVTVTLSGAGTGTTTTNATGNYSFPTLLAGTYTVTPSLTGYTYSPAAPSVAISSADATQNFTASSVLTSYSISGTITYSGSKTGRVFVFVFDNNCTTCPVFIAGTSVTLTSGSAPYTIRGLPSSSYTVGAEMDTNGTTAGNASNPIGFAYPSITSANASGVAITLADPATPTPVTPAAPVIFPSSGSVRVMYKPSINSNGEEIGTAYNLYWGTDAAATNGTGSPVTFPAHGARYLDYFLGGLPNSPLYFKLSSCVGTCGPGNESAPSTVVGPIYVGAAPGPGTYTVSGTVTFPGAATGPLYVGVSGPAGFYYTVIQSPTSPQSYSVAGVPNGTYTNFAFIDENNNGVVDIGDMFIFEPEAAVLTVSGAGVVGNIALSSASETASVVTDNWTDGTHTGYRLGLTTLDGTKQAVNVVVYSGPNVPVPFDLGNNDARSFIQPVYLPLSAAPTVGDTYGYHATFSDGSSADYSATVTGVLGSGSYPASLTENTTGSYTRNVPQFAWGAPPSPPASFAYFVEVAASSAWWYYPGVPWGLPSSTLTAVYNADGFAFPASLTTGTTYNVWVGVMDANRNTATYRTTYTP